MVSDFHRIFGLEVPEFIRGNDLIYLMIYVRIIEITAHCESFDVVGFGSTTRPAAGPLVVQA